jgi:hypothetical protein
VGPGPAGTPGAGPGSTGDAGVCRDVGDDADTSDSEDEIVRCRLVNVIYNKRDGTKKCVYQCTTKRGRSRFITLRRVRGDCPDNVNL